MRSIIFAILVIGSICASAQKVIISGKEGNRQLVWKDFTGKPDDNSSFFALTYWTLNWKTNDIRPQGDVLVVGSFEAVLELDPKHSWVKPGKESDPLLEHEQGHFDIGILCMRELIAKEKLLVLKKSNFSEKLQGLFDEVMKKYHDMEERYDKETDHNKNAEQQQKWNDLIKTQLAAVN